MNVTKWHEYLYLCLNVKKTVSIIFTKIYTAYKCIFKVCVSGEMLQVIAHVPQYYPLSHPFLQKTSLKSNLSSSAQATLKSDNTVTAKTRYWHGKPVGQINVNQQYALYSFLCCKHCYQSHIQGFSCIEYFEVATSIRIRVPTDPYKVLKRLKIYIFFVRGGNQFCYVKKQ